MLILNDILYEQKNHTRLAFYVLCVARAQSSVLSVEHVACGFVCQVAHMPVDEAHEPECRHFDGYPDSGIADWHKKHGLTYGPPEDEG